MSVDSPVWLEVALNGAAGQAFQPGIPVRPADIIQQGIDCAKAGASIIHLHVYNEAGEPVEDADLYSQVIEGIRSHCDAIVYPTLALNGDVEQRYAPISTLAKRGLMEWGVVDPGSVNITHRSQAAAQMDGLVYSNPDSHIRAGLELAARDNWRPAFAIYEPGFVRLGSELSKQVPKLATPIYRVMFSDNLLFGMAPSELAVNFYADHLAQLVPNAPWMLSGLDADIMSIMPLALSRGAHLRVGLEDAPFGCVETNLQLVEQAVALINREGRTVASPTQVRNSY
ncbi:3-keto-5-aminohexanoate cleavage protein [Arenicella xantha]|uniref:Uncharacterized protein (DUF849 family) n=1 Tax=Arenicella xantha TaxID=644221 RepID=A0A395JLJ2_9GAMM|nr:3-keto-5-aminohexanoate cleavage protein [Arenicella xantha]RBP51581.1 uncharacterized protein (DUF849 family) [Arenicella xantha]